MNARSLRSQYQHAVWVAVVAFLIGVGAPARADDKDAGAPKSTLPACVQVTTESRYVPYGYNHIVTIRNGCSRDATCVVSTDVNPKPESVEVPTAKAVEVATFLGAASSVFVAKVTCALR